MMMITSYKPLKTAATKLKEKKAAKMNDSKNEGKQVNWLIHQKSLNDENIFSIV